MKKWLGKLFQTQLNKKFKSVDSKSSQGELDREVGANKNTLYIELPTFIGNPYALIGQIVQVPKIFGETPDELNGISCPFILHPIKNLKIDELSKLKNPLQRASIIANSEVIAKTSVLKYLNGQIKNTSVFSLLVFDRAIGRVNQNIDSYETAIDEWKSKYMSKYADKHTAILYLITGFVQKEIIRKSYKKMVSSANGGAFTVSVDGELHTSNEDYYLDILFGLEATVLYKHEKIVYQKNTDIDTDSGFIGFITQDKMFSIMEQPKKKNLSTEELFATITNIKVND